MKLNILVHFDSGANAIKFFWPFNVPGESFKPSLAFVLDFLSGAPFGAKYECRPLTSNIDIRLG